MKMIMEKYDVAMMKILLAEYGRGETFTRAQFEEKFHYRCDVMTLDTLREWGWIRVNHEEKYIRADKRDLREYELTFEQLMALPRKVREALDIDCFEAKRYHYALDFRGIANSVASTVVELNSILTDLAKVSL